MRRTPATNARRENSNNVKFVTYSRGRSRSRSPPFQQFEDVELGVAVLTDDADIGQRPEFTERQIARFPESFEFPLRDGDDAAAQLPEVRRLPFQRVRLVGGCIRRRGSS